MKNKEEKKIISLIERNKEERAKTIIALEKNRLAFLKILEEETGEIIECPTTKSMEDILNVFRKQEKNIQILILKKIHKYLISIH